MRALAKSPDERFANANEFAAGLRGVKDGTMMQPSTEARQPYEEEKPQKKQPAFFMVTVSLMVMLIVILFVFIGVLSWESGILPNLLGRELPSPTAVVMNFTETPDPSLYPSQEPSGGTPAAAFAEVNVQAANVRRGPGMNYDIIGWAKEGEKLPIGAYNPSRDWLQVSYTTAAGEVMGWMSVSIVRVEGDAANIPVTQNIPPSPTPVPTETATDTPQPTETPTETATPTPSPTSPPPTIVVDDFSCTIAPREPFLSLWVGTDTVREKLGCPTERGVSTHGIVQSFQQGVALERADTRIIYFLYGAGEWWDDFLDTWTSSQPEQLGMTPPSDDLLEPKRGIGMIWRENLGGANGQFAWATAPEERINSEIQKFSGGLIFANHTDEVMYVMYNENDTFEQYALSE